MKVYSESKRVPFSRAKHEKFLVDYANCCMHIMELSDRHRIQLGFLYSDKIGEEIYAFLVKSMDSFVGFKSRYLAAEFFSKKICDVSGILIPPGTVCDFIQVKAEFVHESVRRGIDVEDFSFVFSKTDPNYR